MVIDMPRKQNCTDQIGSINYWSQSCSADICLDTFIPLFLYFYLHDNSHHESDPQSQGEGGGCVQSGEAGGGAVLGSLYQAAGGLGAPW